MTHSPFTPQHRSLAAYKFWYSDAVRFTDLDALGHVSSVMIGGYFAGARTKLFKETIDGWPKSPTVPVLRSSLIEHEGELYFPTEFQVGLAIEKFGTTSLILVMGLFVENECLALCRNVFVFVDTVTRKSTPIPEETRARMMTFAL